VDRRGAAMKPQRTYWHLEALGRRPSEYEIATSRLLYHPQRGFEVDVPVADWYRRHQRESPLKADDWDVFHDPRETTYTRYVTLQNQRETFVTGLLRAHDGGGGDARLPEAAAALLERVMAPLRYPGHALQMAAAYVAQMAPGGRIVIAAMFQAADEMRRVERLAYRLRLLQHARPGFGDDSRSRWEGDPAWQGLRELLERLLTTWDWGEAFAALNFAVKPAFDELMMNHFAAAARAAGEELLPQMFFSLNEDCAWHRDWSRALARAAIAARPENRAVLQDWVDAWRPRAVAAMAPLAEVMSPGSAGTIPRQIEDVLRHHWATASS